MKRRLAFTVSQIFIFAALASGQTLEHRTPVPVSPAPGSVSLILPAGTPLQVALPNEVRVHNVGQPIEGKIVEPAYAFDKLVIPVGTQVFGKITEIKHVPKMRRTYAALNANFTPHHDLGIEFTELALPDGSRIPIQTVVTMGSQNVLQFATANHKDENKIKQAATDRANAKKDEIKRDWETAKAQIHEPGKMHRIKRLAVAQLPIHPQYLDAGTHFNAELQQPLDFGQETFTSEQLALFGTQPPDGSIVHALLTTPLSSATTHKGAQVEAIITEPLSSPDHLLVLPEGSRLLGTVLESRPARLFARSGQLRVVFHEIIPPGGFEQRVEASLEGVEAGKDEHLKLDSEGGAEVVTPKTRYAVTAISIALAATSFNQDIDKGVDEHPGGTYAGRAENGGSGLGLVGVALGALVHSRVLASSMGVYGASMSVYTHFIARGRDVVYPKNTAMAIGIGTHPTNPVPATGKPADSPNITPAAATPQPVALVPADSLLSQ